LRLDGVHNRAASDRFEVLSDDFSLESSFRSFAQQRVLQPRASIFQNLAHGTHLSTSLSKEHSPKRTRKLLTEACVTFIELSRGDTSVFVFFNDA